ncbi:MAG TPA: hypothetical protein VLL51_08895, partial [Gemmatimonadales bacterium]|nr:hypothetical protein [Gemmatimonadales bacterium]
LFEEAAGIGLYRDRKHATERRLEETAADLQRLEDLLSEVQSQIRSLARQKGRAERHARLTEEKFIVQLTLAQRMLENLSSQAAGLESRHAELNTQLPELRTTLAAKVAEQDQRARARVAAESHRAGIARELSEAQVALAKLEADIAVAVERLTGASTRKLRAEEERAQLDLRGRQAREEREAAEGERREAEGEHQRVQLELSGRTTTEEEVRLRLAAQRESVRSLEQELQAKAQSLRSFEGERTALDGELASLRERTELAAAHLQSLRAELGQAERRSAHATEAAAGRSRDAGEAAAAAERMRHAVAETREREATERVLVRQAEESLAQLTARRQALEELERDRVGLAPGAAALMAVRAQFDGAILGPLSDFLATERQDAELAERLLGESVHAVLVRDWAAVERIQEWHAGAEPGALVLLPVDPGPNLRTQQPHPLAHRLRVEGPASAWVDALVGGSEVLEASGRVLRRASGAVFLGGVTGPTGPIRRRADLAQLAQDVIRQEGTLSSAVEALASTRLTLERTEQDAEAAAVALSQAQEAERQAIGLRDDAHRQLANLRREVGESDLQLVRLQERLGQAEHRLMEVDAALAEGEQARNRLVEFLAAARAALAALETDQEGAREARLHWQVQEAHLGARLRSALERLERADRTAGESEATLQALGAELARLEAEAATLTAQVSQWQ